MRVIRFAIKHSRLLVVLSVVTGIVTGVSSTALIALINTALTNTGIPKQSLIIIYITLCVVLPLARLTSAVSLINLSQRVAYNLRMHLSERILAAPLRHLEQIGTHRLLASLTDDAMVISNGVVNIPVVCIDLTILIGCLSYIGYLSWPVLLIELGFIAVGVISYQLPVARANRRLRLARELQNDLLKHFSALTDGIKELKLHQERANAFLKEALHPSAEAVCRQTVWGMTSYAAASSWGQVLLFVFIGLLLFSLSGILTVSVEVMTGCALVALYMVSSLEMIVNVLPMLGRAEIALQNIENLGLSLASQTTENTLPASSQPLPKWQRLEVNQVVYHYRPEDGCEGFTVGPIDMQLTPGEIVFVTGGNGSGKTTYAKLLTGLYVPDAGEIRCNGFAVNDENRFAYRQNFSAVFFDFFLFDCLLGLDTSDADAEISGYLTALDLAHKVEVRKGLLSTTELSQGQRKRLALLTAYLENRPIYVFDEWAADQDPIFKDVFYYQLLPELKQRGKAVVVISHDDRYFNIADRLIKLDSGRVDYLAGSRAAKIDVAHTKPKQPLKDESVMTR
jgi:putative ATP-binding cassette transporter